MSIKALNAIRFGLMGIAVVVAFMAGNYVVKLYLDNTPAAQEAKAMVSQYRPGFLLPDLTGEMRNMNEWNGKVTVVNFWATWCPPCRKEMPVFIELQKKYGAQGLQFVGIALDDENKVQDYIATLGLEYPILLGDDDAIRVSEDFGNRLGALPYTAVIDREGFIVRTYRGEVSQNSLERLINNTL